MEEKVITSPLKAIRAKCINCCGGSKNEVELCPITKCPLYEFRKGKNPYNKRTLTEEQKQAASERFKKMWEDKRKEEKGEQ